MPDARTYYKQGGYVKTAAGARKKGYRFEHAQEMEFNRYVPGTSRPRAGQPLDEGDLLIPNESRFIIQCKNVVSLNLAGAIRAAEQQARNKQQHLGLEETPAGVLVWKRPRALLKDARLQYVTFNSWHADRLVPADVEIVPLPSARALHISLGDAFSVWPNGIFAGNPKAPYTYMLVGRFLDLVYPDGPVNP